MDWVLWSATDLSELLEFAREPVVQAMSKLFLKTKVTSCKSAGLEDPMLFTQSQSSLGNKKYSLVKIHPLRAVWVPTLGGIERATRQAARLHWGGGDVVWHFPI